MSERDEPRTERELIHRELRPPGPPQPHDELVHHVAPEDAGGRPHPQGLVTNALDLLKRSAQGWVRDKSPRIAAALSYYAVIALAPLLILAVALMGLLLDTAATREFLVGQARAFAGPQIAAVVDTVVQGAGNRAGSGLAAVLGIGAAILGATGGFAQLQDALNTVWNVSRKRKLGLLGALLSRVPSFLMLIVVGTLLLLSAVASAVFGSLDFPLQGGALPPWLLQLTNFVISTAVLTAAFSAVYKVLPDTDVRWSDVLFGAFVTALLFSLGKSVLGIYLGRSAVASTFGAAGSLVVLLLWLYYTAQIVLFGAEFTQVWACTYGSRKSGELCGVPVAEQQGAPEQPQGPSGRGFRGGAHVT